MIQKHIHIIWIGDQSKRPVDCIQTWIDMNPTYQIKVWGNDDLKYTPWMTASVINQWLNHEINGAADVMRWEILYRFGGIAIDADSICVRPLEDWLLEPDVFAVWENEIIRPGLIACGALGCIPNHPFIGQIITDILQDQNQLSNSAWVKVGPGRITKTMRDYQYSSLTVYPSHYFIPEHFTGIMYQGSGQVFSRQAWGSTHKNYGNLKFIKDSNS